MGMPLHENLEQIYEFSPIRPVYPQFSATYPQDLGICSELELFYAASQPVYMGVAYSAIMSIILAVRCAYGGANWLLWAR